MAELNEKDGIIYTASGEPFKNEQAAKMRASVLARDGIITKPVEHEDGGYVLVHDGTTEKPRRKFWEEPRALFIREEDKDQEFTYRIVNDDENFWRNRVKLLASGGWEVVKENLPMSDGTINTAQQVGGISSMPVGQGVRGVLMRKLARHYKEDYKIKESQNDGIMLDVLGRPEAVDGGAAVMPVDTTIGVMT